MQRIVRSRILVLMLSVGLVFCNDIAIALTTVTTQETANEIAEQSGERKAEKVPVPAQERTSQNRDNVVLLLAKEMNQLIPSDYSADETKFQLLKSIAELFVDGNRVAVDKRLADIAAADPDVPPALLLIAGMHYAINDTKGGGELLEKLAIEKPDNPSVFVAFSRLAFSQNRISDALALCEKAATKTQQAKFSPAAKSFYDTQVADLMTMIAARQNRLEDADKFAARWEKLAPKSTKMLMARAEIKFQANDMPATLDYLKQVRERDKNSRVPEIIVASWYQRKRDAANVARWVKEAVKKYPNDASVQLEHGNWALSVEDFETATAAVAKFESLEKESLNSMMLKSRIAFATRQYGDAEKLLEQLFQARPRSFDVSNLYALALVESSDTDKQKLARQIAQRNIRSLPNNKVAAAAMGWVLLKMGDVENATAILSQSARSAELPPEVTFFIAMMLERNGKTAQAKMILEPVMGSEGMFLYRSRAKELLARLSGNSSLPAPKK